MLKTMQTMTTFRNPLADPLWSADPSLKTAALHNKQHFSGLPPETS